MQCLGKIEEFVSVEQAKLQRCLHSRMLSPNIHRASKARRHKRWSSLYTQRLFCSLSPDLKFRAIHLFDQVVNPDLLLGGHEEERFRAVEPDALDFTLMKPRSFPMTAGAAKTKDERKE